MRHGNWLASGALLALGIFLLSGNAATSADDDAKKTIKAAQKDIVDLAKDVESGKIDPKRAAAIRKKYEDLQDVMTVFKPRGKVGLGVGPVAEFDGIEIKLRNLRRGALSKAALDKESADLIKMAYVNLAAAEIVEHYAPAKKNKEGKSAKEWKQHTADWKKASKEFVDAVKKKNPAAVKKAAGSIDEACVSCHNDFKE